MLDVWFIRHGECTANIGEATRTATEAALTARGRAEARCIADYLVAEQCEPALIISSDYRRATETAQPTLRYFSYLDLHIREVGEFNYLALPNDLSTTGEDRLHLVQGFWKRCDPFHHHRDGAESFADFTQRVQDALNELCQAAENGFIVVFTHQQFIQAVRWLLLQKKPMHPANLQSRHMNHFYEQLNTFSIPNGAILKTSLCSRQFNLETSHLTATLVSPALADASKLATFACNSRHVPDPLHC